MKKLLASIVFCVLFAYLFFNLNELTLDKKFNRYYMLREELEDVDKDFDVQLFGPCHSYTTFNPIQFQEEYGIESYNMANPNEIIPVTYLNMIEQFKNYTPKVAVVEVWGVNAYESYVSYNQTFNETFPISLEILPFSKEKLEVINDFETVDKYNESIYLSKYKSRIFDHDISVIDYDYDFNETSNLYFDEMDWLYIEMENRFEHNGFKLNEPVNIEAYPEVQNYVEDDEIIPVDSKLMKYVDKIIALCEENGVELIFYRAPYLSEINEMKRANYLRDYFDEKGIPFYDLEKELEFDYTEDFNDTHHLSSYGASKATSFLGQKIFELY